MKIPNPETREIRTTAVDFSFGEILNLHNDKEIVIQPEYQRLFRWSTEQRSRLIESILLGLPIPPIFLIEDDDGILELIDGLQRVSSVLQFVDSISVRQPKLYLTGCDFLKNINDKSYSDLDTVQKMRIKRTPIRAIIINKSGDQYVKYEMFKRLNTGGSLLSAQEIRNCSSRMIEGGTEFYETIQSLSKYRPFRQSTSRLPDSTIEMRGNEELVLRYFAVTKSRDSYRGNIEEWLDTYMENILFGEEDFDSEIYSDEFKAVFSLIFKKLSGSAFTRFNDRGEPTGRLAPAYFEAVVATFSENMTDLSSVSSEDIVDRLKKAFSSRKFKRATGPGANTIEKLGLRIEAVKEHLLP